MADLLEIARRKERLIARCAAQRDIIAGAVRDLRQPIAIADRVYSAALYLRARPVLVAVAVAAVVALRRPNLLSLAGRGLSLWRVWRKVSALVRETTAHWRRRGSRKP